MADVIETTSKVINDARNKAVVSVRAYARPKVISSAIELVISVLIIGGVQLMSFGFNIDALMHWKFWARTGVLTVGIFILYRAVINARYYKTENRESVLKVKEAYVERNKHKTLEMKQWLKNVFNLQTKTETYIDRQNYKINAIEKKIVNCYSPKKKEKLELKLETLQATITTEYITSHINTIRVKYYVVYYSDFQDITLYGNGSVFTRGNYGLAFNLASIKKMWVYVLTTALLGVSVVTIDTYTAASVITAIGTTAFMCATRIVTALLEADQLYDKTITASLLGRIEVLDEWIKYQQDHPTEREIISERAKIEKTLREELKLEYDAKYEKQLEEAKVDCKNECMAILKTKYGVIDEGTI